MPRAARARLRELDEKSSPSHLSDPLSSRQTFAATPELDGVPLAPIGIFRPVRSPAKHRLAPPLSPAGRLQLRLQVPPPAIRLPRPAFRYRDPGSKPAKSARAGPTRVTAFDRRRSFHHLPAASALTGRATFGDDVVPGGDDFLRGARNSCGTPYRLRARVLGPHACLWLDITSHFRIVPLRLSHVRD